jgi:cyclopropane-fatty-acyl-phospholipid synthase
MTYSSGLYSHATQSLDTAQTAKIDRVIELLDLRGGERVLEIGCGWGGFAERLLQKSDCSVTAVTLSAEQLDYARQRLDASVTNGRCELLHCDYRNVKGTFDRIVSIEMIEAVGEAYWPTYFAKLRDCLRPGGLAVLQVITIDGARFEDYRRRPDFIQKYIFPGGMLPTARIIERETDKAGLRLIGSEFFGDSYARTLDVWRNRFKNAWPRIKVHFDDRFERMWEYYLTYCQVGFESGDLDVGLFTLARA